MLKEKSYWVNTRYKQSVGYVCQECGATEYIQAHHQIPGDDNSLIALCSICHSKKHPNMPFNLFINKNYQPYWHNQSINSVAKEFGVCWRTIYRRAKKLNIGKGYLSEDSKRLLREIAYARKAKPYEEGKCNNCHSDNIISWGRRMMGNGTKVSRYQCQNCGHVGDCK